MQATSDFLGTEPVGRLTLRLAIPAVTAQLVNMLYNLVDRMYIGHIADIARWRSPAWASGAPLILLIAAFAALVFMGGAPRVSMLMGKGENEQAERVMGNCFTLLVGLSILLTIVISIWDRDLLLLFGASENTVGYAEEYMRIYTLGTLFVQLTLGMNAFITAQGFAKVSMLTVLIGALCNIVLDPLFIFVFDLGVQGAAIATVLSQAVSAVWVMLFITSKKCVLRLKLRNLLRSAASGRALHSAGAVPVRDAVDRECAVCLLQRLAAEVRRRHRRRRDDHPRLRDAVRYAAAARTDAGLAADRQL